MQYYNRPFRSALSQDYWMVAKHVNNFMLANNVFWRLMLFNTHLLLLLQPSVLWLSIVSFNNDSKPPPKWILREFDVSRIGPRLGGLRHLERLHGKIWPRLRGLPCLADRATRLGGSRHLSCKRDQIKMRDHVDRRVTSPTWGPPPPCKQALRSHSITKKFSLNKLCINITCNPPLC